jgi:hypothetical protein
MGLAPAISLFDAITEHLSVTEGEHGLYAEIVAADPRLAFAVQSLMREHAELRRMQRSRLSDRQRDAATRLLDRHTRRGNDLVYEAFVVDVGGES